MAAREVGQEKHNWISDGRLEFIGDLAGQYKVDGIVLQDVRFCTYNGSALLPAITAGPMMSNRRNKGITLWLTMPRNSARRR
jgi:hypothetical protein